MPHACSGTEDCPTVAARYVARVREVEAARLAYAEEHDAPNGDPGGIPGRSPYDGVMRGKERDAAGARVPCLGQRLAPRTAEYIKIFSRDS